MSHMFYAIVLLLVSLPDRIAFFKNWQDVMTKKKGPQVFDLRTPLYLARYIAIAAIIPTITTAYAKISMRSG